MSYQLLIESSMPHCSVALSHEGRHLYSLRHSEVNSHSSNLHGFIDKLFAETGIHKSKLTSIAYSEGPGSYTGLRIGLSAAKGLAYGLDIPLVGIPTLKLIAWKMREKVDVQGDYILLSMIDAGRMEVYLEGFDSRLLTLFSPQALIIEANTLQTFTQGQNITVFLGGSGSTKCARMWNSPVVRDLAELSTSATDMIDLGWEGFQNNLFKDLAYCEPNYLKPYRPGKKKSLFGKE